MNKIIIRKGQKDDFKAIANLIASQNTNPQTHCIHSDTGEDAAGICSEMTRLDANSEICLVMSLQNEKLSGVMGCELDVELGRGWLRGPFVVEDAKDFNVAATCLFNGLKDLLPASIHQLDTFLNIKNQRGNDFYLSRDFKQLRLVHVYDCQPPAKNVIQADLCEPIRPKLRETFIRLHDAIFPGTYATGRRILEKIDDQHQVFVRYQDKELIGYCCANIDEDTGDGSLDFLGVREDARGKGIGRQLLQTALHWLFEVKKVPQVILVVHDEQANARSLYESVGFRLKYTGVHNRRISD